MFVRGLTIDPEEGCGGYFCIEHLSLRSSNRLVKNVKQIEDFQTEDLARNKTDEDMANDETVHRLCLGCHGLKEKTCSWNERMTWLLFGIIILSILWFGVPYAINKIGPWYEKQDPSNL